MAKLILLTVAVAFVFGIDAAPRSLYHAGPRAFLDPISRARRIEERDAPRILNRRVPSLTKDMKRDDGGDYDYDPYLACMQASDKWLGICFDKYLHDDRFKDCLGDADKAFKLCEEHHGSDGSDKRR